MSSAQFSVFVVENDQNNDTLMTWSFPGVSSALQGIIERRCEDDGASNTFVYFKYKNEWVYVYSVPAKKNVQPDVNRTSIGVISKLFNPEKYQSIGSILSEQYISSGDPTKLLEGYLSITTTNKFSNSAGSFDMTAYNDSNAYAMISKIKDLNSMLNIDIVIVWNAVLLKKRILVIGSDCNQVLSIVRTLPQLAWHRQDWSILRPLIRNEQEHIDDLLSSGVFIAGTTDTSMGDKSELFDVILSLDEGRITITTHAVPTMRMCSIHREVSQLINEESEKSSTNDLDVIREVTTKTNDIIMKLKTLCSENGNTLTEEIINNSISNAAAQQWLIRLATAEGML